MAEAGAKNSEGVSTLAGQLRRQVEEANRRIKTEYIEAVHQKYSKGCVDGIKLDVFKQALSEIRPEFEKVSDDEIEKYFVEMDVENNKALDIDEFRHALQKLFPIEQAVSVLPLSRLIASSLPGLTSLEIDDHLVAFSKLRDEEVAAMASAVTFELEKELLVLVRSLRDGFEVKSIAVDGNDAGAKFSVQGSVTMSGGMVEDFHGGLSQRVGAPDLAFEDAVEMEHCKKDGHDFEFTTSNYKIKTTSKKEYDVVVNNAKVDPADMMHSRRIPNLKDLQDLELSKAAGLRKIEIIMLVLYTGPMFMIYNAILRRFPANIFDVFQKANNLYPTSIHVLQSAVTKIARNTKIPTGLKLYRGLSMAFPRMFYESDKNGCRGFAEWGFMSTTTNRAIAVMYSGVREGKKYSSVLEIRTSSIDRAACIQLYSQYMGECEYLWVPLSFLESTGAIRKEATEFGILTVMELRVNFNGKVMTTDELVGLKRSIHLKAFSTSIEAFSYRKLSSISNLDSSVVSGTEVNPIVSDKKEKDWKKLKMGIVEECKQVMEQHEKHNSDDFTQEGIYRKLIIEMIDTERFALSKAQWWELSGDDVATVMLGSYRPLRTCHRLLLGEQRKALNNLEPGSREETERATNMCLTLGLFVESPDETNELGEQRLTQAAADNASPDLLRLLLKARADVNAATKPGGFTAAYRAAQFGYAACLQVLVEAKADVNLAEDDGATPAWMAAQNGNLDCLKLLKTGGADFDQPDKARDTDVLINAGGDTPAHMAALNGKVECLQWLKEAGANISKANAAGRTPVFLATYYGLVECLQWFLTAGVDINASDKCGLSPFLVAAQRNKVECLQLLEKAGADTEAVDNDGDNAAVLACMHGSLECLKHIVKSGKTLTIEACRAAQYERIDCLKHLVEVKADMNVKDSDEFTPVAHAAYFGYTDILKYLLEVGVDINLVDTLGRTPLYYAAQEGNFDCLQFLKEAGSNVNASDKDGANPLLAAAQNGHIECLRFLISARADINAKDSHGKTALVYAVQAEADDCVQLLKESGAKDPSKDT